MIYLLALLLGPWNPNSAAGPAPVVGPDGGAVAVYLVNPASTDGGGVAVTNWPSNQQVEAHLVFDGGAVSILSLPAVYIADGGVNVGNWPANQQVEAHVVFDGGPVSLINFTGLTDVQLRADYLNLRPLAPFGPDGGDTQDVSGSSVVVTGRVYVANPPLNPFLPRCNPVRRTGCQP